MMHVWLWIARWGGAEWIEGRFISGFLVHIWAVTWTSEQIKVFAYGALFFGTILFILGMFSHDFRVFGLI
jgi:hypothetical protein